MRPEPRLRENTEPTADYGISADRVTHTFRSAHWSFGYPQQAPKEVSGVLDGISEEYVDCVTISLQFRGPAGRETEDAALLVFLGRRLDA